MALTFSTRKETAAKRARERGGDFNARRGGGEFLTNLSAIQMVDGGEEPRL